MNVVLIVFTDEQGNVVAVRPYPTTGEYRPLVFVPGYRAIGYPLSGVNQNTLDAEKYIKTAIASSTTLTPQEKIAVLEASATTNPGFAAFGFLPARKLQSFDAQAPITGVIDAGAIPIPVIPVFRDPDFIQLVRPS